MNLGSNCHYSWQTLLVYKKRQIFAQTNESDELLKQLAQTIKKNIFNHRISYSNSYVQAIKKNLFKHQSCQWRNCCACDVSHAQNDRYATGVPFFSLFRFRKAKGIAFVAYLSICQCGPVFAPLRFCSELHTKKMFTIRCLFHSFS